MNSVGVFGTLIFVAVAISILNSPRQTQAVVLYFCSALNLLFGMFPLMIIVLIQSCIAAGYMLQSCWQHCCHDTYFANEHSTSMLRLPLFCY